MIGAKRKNTNYGLTLGEKIQRIQEERKLALQPFPEIKIAELNEFVFALEEFLLRVVDQVEQEKFCVKIQLFKSRTEINAELSFEGVAVANTALWAKVVEWFRQFEKPQYKKLSIQRQTQFLVKLRRDVRVFCDTLLHRWFLLHNDVRATCKNFPIIEFQLTEK